MSEHSDAQIPHGEILRMTAQVVAAYLGHNALPAGQIPDVIDTVFGALAKLGDGAAAARGDAPKPAVPVKRSITPDYIVCLEDGRKLKMLKRHLRTTYKLTPEAYRVRWGLAADYPMVAPNYAKQRSEFAKKIGLGRGPGKASRRRKAG